MPETISGQIERVTFHNPDSGFAVLRVNVRGAREPVSLVGRVASAAAGEHVEATGRWVIDPQHGRQFQADEVRTAHPASAEGIERYLGSGAIRGIGPSLAARIVQLYGQRTLDILNDYPDQLLHIRGIGPQKLQRIRASWDEQRHVRQIMIFLQELGIGAGDRAIRIYRRYGQQAIAAIKANPYRLADDIRGIGFKLADQIAARLGIDRQSPQRAQAGVRYTLGQLTDEGHCGYPEAALVERAVELLEIPAAGIEAAVAAELAAGALVRQSMPDGPWIYLAALHRAEVGVAAAIRRLLAGRHPLPGIDLERAVAWAQQRLGLELAAGQREALRQACSAKVLVITGGPGVGKTTLVRSILEIFEAKGLHCALAAPTGRAAKRLAETTGRTAKTVHRLLEFDPRTGDFLRDAERPLETDLLVLDETSMVDVVLGHQLLRAVPDGACVLLVGDVDQLPSVGPGTLLADLIGSGVVPVVRLTEIFRQAAGSRIVKAAYAVNRGQVPELGQPESPADFYFIPAEEPERIGQLIVRLVRERMPDRFGLDPLRDIQVLTPMNRTLLGSRALNELLQAALNPADERPSVERFGWTFRVGDRVMQTENNYTREVFNGDLGVVEKINRVEQELTVQIDGRPVTYDFADLDELALAYAVSIHKSQGSEYPGVVVPLHTSHYVMLRRNLLYTAVTRGKQVVVLVGSQRALELAVRRADTARRYTALRWRLGGMFPSPLPPGEG